MAILAAIIRFWSYLFHIAICLFFLGLSLVALSSGLHTVRIPVLPWEGAALTWWLLGLGLAGLLIIWLALKGTLRILFLLWTLTAVVVIARGFIFSQSVVYADAGEFRQALYLVAAALAAAAGGYSQFRRKPRRR